MPKTQRQLEAVIVNARKWACGDGKRANANTIENIIQEVQNAWQQLGSMQHDDKDDDDEDSQAEIYQETLNLLENLIKSLHKNSNEAAGTSTTTKTTTQASSVQHTSTLDELKRKVKRHTHGLARIEKMLETDASIHALDSIMELLEEHWRGFNSNLSWHSDEEDMEDTMSSTEILYLRCKTQIKQRIAAATPPILQTAGSAPPDNHNTSGSRLKLPAIQIGKFNGDYKNWTAFHDLFSKLVNDDGTLSGAQKLYYLRSSVVDEAELLIKSYEISDANYLLAWNALKCRYQNKRLIINSHLRTLFDKSTLNEENASQMRTQLDAFTESVNQLSAQGMPTMHWDAILVFMFTQKLDHNARQQWELSLINDEIPTFKQLQEFVEVRTRSLAISGSYSTQNSTVAHQQTSANNNNQRTTRGNQPQRSHHSTTNSAVPPCAICKSTHFVYACPEFAKLVPHDRYKLAVEHHLCFNCLRTTHSTKSCLSGPCRKCNARHHTMLHYENRRSDISDGGNSNALPKKQSQTNASDLTAHCGINNNSDNSKFILLATAMAQIIAPDKTAHPVRILLDSGSQTSFVTEACVKRIGLQRSKASIPISGLGSCHTTVTRGLVKLHLKSNIDQQFNINIDALVLNCITSKIPSAPVAKNCISFLNGKPLADPYFNTPASIDMLIGADAYGQILLGEVITGNEIMPTAQNTSLGWILFGPIISNASTLNLHSTVSLHNHLELADALIKFWELENIGTSSTMTEKERQCEEFFARTHDRNKDGRFIVSLPTNSDCKTTLGDSYANALKSFQYLERRFLRSPELKLEYVKFIQEYLDLNHMELAKSIGTENPKFYLPHHPVFKMSGGVNKIRVVFDASRKTSSGISLNDTLLVGPKIQLDLIDILLRFRRHKVAFTCDIAKMYRQILLNKQQRDLQRIIWRESPHDNIEHFVLKTVTYGTSSAAYLATKSLQQLAIYEKKKYPLASKATLTDFYVDDLMTGCDSVPDAIKLQREMIEMLQSGGMELRKWSSNSVEVLEHIPLEHRDSDEPAAIGYDKDEPIKTLGLFWHPKSDKFGYKVELSNYDLITKRKVLSEVAKLFDPLGFLAPVIVTAKIFMQNLWAAGVDWDEPLPENLKTSWLKFRKNLHALDNVKVNRFIGTSANAKYQLHGFCDSSEAAYGAVAFLRVSQPNGTITVEIISAKTKVAPTKKISLPRLELCGALLLARLMTHISKTLEIDFSMHAWTDSTVVLAWLRKPSYSWQTFVANRVAEVQTLLPPEKWKHIGGNENPADCSSRGIPAETLANFNLWWNGPSWLAKHESHWPKYAPIISTQIDEKKASLTMLSNNHIEPTMLNSCSSWKQLKLRTAYVWRFIKNCRKNGAPKGGNISVCELQQAAYFWIGAVQQTYFHLELNACRKNHSLPTTSSLRSLNPFLDSNGILRVGGRLSHSSLPYESKHQIILPKIGHLTNLIVSDSHLQNLHGGAQITLCHLRQTYWIVGGRSVVKQHIHRCITCVRHSKKPGNQLLANLPPKRVQPGRPFLTSGVDYAGPFTLKQYSGRCKRTTKAYVALFVCFSTKATHIELVSDLTTDAFLAAFRRFTARRGKCADLHSDCGTNFVGANRELQSLLKSLKSQLAGSSVNNSLALDGTNWHFIPPGSPSLGGIWEAGVKQVKRHLTRIIGSHTTTFEEMATILAQIEACLNSRPLCALSDDANDYDALTPGHFLIGHPLTSVPDPDVTHIATNRLSRWQLVQQLVQHFWHRWNHEYLASLQQRNKWLQIKENVKVGSLVLIIDERLSPCKWSLGRITELHPGVDGLVRVVTIRTSNGTTKRTINKLIILPIDE